MKIIFVFCIQTIIQCITVLGNSVDIKTSSGLVRGQTISVLNTTIDEFLGIPFAEPPVGDLRFAKPKPIEKPLEGVIDATKIKNSCIQPLTGGLADAFLALGKLTISEDCLYLNIWSPNSDSQNKSDLKPVMFWIYGGALKLGSIFQITYNGSLLATNDVIIVSANYRLGAFGFLFGDDDTAPGNQGLYDQLLALKWVRENIHLFGGDKNQITIFGESAGSWSVSSHIISPLSKGLFKRAILESGAQMHYKKRPVHTTEEALNNAKQMADHFKCGQKDVHWLTCLREIDAKSIDAFNEISVYFPLEGTEFLPITAQNAFKDGKYDKDIDIIAGVNRNEGSLIVKLIQDMVNPDIDLGVEFVFDLLSNVINNVFGGIDVQKVKDFYLKNVNKSNSTQIRNAFYDFVGDLILKCPTYLFAKQFAELTPGKGVYFYELTYESKIMRAMGCKEESMGICHGADVVFVFGLPISFHVLYPSKIDEDFSTYVMKLWTNFAKNGNPGNDWPLFSNGSDVLVKELNPNKMNNIFKNPFTNDCEDFWSNYYLN